jgi:hypothetical protein
VKGVIFNLLEELVTAEFGEDVWDDLLDDAGLEGAYTSLGSYPDSDVEALLAAAGQRLSMTRGDVLRWFGRKAIAPLARSYPGFFEPHHGARPFILGVNDIIHAEVRKLYTGADCPHFNFREATDGALVMDYRSKRRMCALAQGFIEGAADHYGEQIDFRHDRCVDHGDPHCSFSIAWRRAEAA